MNTRCVLSSTGGASYTHGNGHPDSQGPFDRCDTAPCWGERAPDAESLDASSRVFRGKLRTEYCPHFQLPKKMLTRLDGGGKEKGENGMGGGVGWVG